MNMLVIPAGWLGDYRESFRSHRRNMGQQTSRAARPAATAAKRTLKPTQDLPLHGTQGKTGKEAGSSVVHTGKAEAWDTNAPATEAEYTAEPSRIQDRFNSQYVDYSVRDATFEDAPDVAGKESSGEDNGKVDAELLTRDRQAAENFKFFKFSMFERKGTPSQSAQRTMDKIRQARAARDLAEKSHITDDGASRKTLRIEEFTVLLKSGNKGPNHGSTAADRIDAMRKTAENWNLSKTILPPFAKYFNVPEPLGRVDPKTNQQKSVWS